MLETQSLTHHAHGQRLRTSLYLLVTLLIVGSGGFYLLGDGHTYFECVYLTAVILTTVGMKESSIHINAAEEAWALLLMLGGISLALYATTNLVAFVVEGELARTFGRRQLQKQIDKQEDHTIVVGFGRMGRELCAALKQRNMPFVLIELDEQLVARADQLGYLNVTGDAMTDTVLSAAGVQRARGMIACLPREADNVFVTLKGRELNSEMTIITRGQHVENESMLRRAGASRVIVPPVLGANRAVQMLVSPAIADLVDMEVAGDDIEVSKMELGDLPNAVGQTLGDLDLSARAGLMVVALVHADGSRQFNPSPDLVLKADDEMIVIGEIGSVDKLVDLYGSKAVH